MNKFDLHKKKTFTSHWNNFSQKPKKKQRLLNYLKHFKKYTSNIFGYKIKLNISKNKVIKDETFTSYQIEKEILEYRNLELLKILQSYLKFFHLHENNNNILKYIKEYVSVYYKSPIKALESGFGFNEGLFLFCIIKILKPTLIIESGVMKGFTTYLIDSAAHDSCKIHCYDINFENLEFKSKKATYYNHDINYQEPNLQNEKVLAFWDDHTSQLDRLLFSLEKKIKYNFFDDDLGFLNFHSDGWPPVPSISMLKEIKDKIIIRDRIDWVCRDRKGQLWLNNIKKNNPFNKIKYHRVFPNLFNATGYKNHSQCSFVITK